MADNSYEYGFRLHVGRGEGLPNPEPVQVATAYSASVSPGPVTCDINIGDPVKKVNDGSVAIAAAGDAVYGIVCAIKQFRDATSGQLRVARNLPAGTTYSSLELMSEILIWPVAGLKFEVDCDDNSTATTETTYRTYIGENCDHVFIPDSGTAKAKPLLDISTHGTGTAQWRIVGIAKKFQDFSGLYTKLIVTCNEVQQAPFITTGV